MLTEDAKMAMPPLPTWYSGRDEVRTFLRHGPLADVNRWRLVPTRANGQIAFGVYVWDEDAHGFVPHGVNVLTLRGTHIEEITIFLTPALLTGFGLPAAIGP